MVCWNGKSMAWVGVGIFSVSMRECVTDSVGEECSCWNRANTIRQYSFFLCFLV